MYKLRKGAYQTNGKPIYVLTVPEEFVTLHPNTHFHVEMSEGIITYTSGTKYSITKKEVEDYDLKQDIYENTSIK